MTDRPFARHYYVDLERDYPQIYQDDHLYATWSRMLNTAEKMWPVVPEIPRSAKAAYVRVLVDATLVIREGPFGYRIKGLDAERSARSTAASYAARIRHGTANGIEVGNASRARPNQTKASTQTKGSTAKPSLESAEPDPADWGHLTAAGEPR